MITIAINGYGNLGRGVEKAISKNDDLELAVVFTRRDPRTVTTLGVFRARNDRAAHRRLQRQSGPERHPGVVVPAAPHH